MTVQEAIKILRTEHVGDSEEMELAKYQAALALEKQIPKKPAYVDTRFRNHGRRIADGVSLSKCYKCPNCNLHIFHVFDSDVHCKHCGQALDWGEEAAG